MDQNNPKSLKSLWKWYKQKVYENCTGRSDTENRLEYWRNQLFAATVLYLIPLSFIVLIPGIYMAFVEQLVYLIVADIIAVISLLLIAFAPRISVYLRKVIFCIAFYLVSIALLFYLGTFGPGLMYLLAMSVFVVLILDQRYGVGVVVLNIIVCVALGVEVNINLLDSAALSNYELDSWVAVSSNLVFLSLLAVILIPKLFDGLEKSMEKQNRLRSENEKNQQKLEKSVDRVEQKNRELSRSEENYRNLFELSPLPMYVFDMKSYKFLDVNKAMVKKYGYSRRELLSKTIKDVRPREEIPRLVEKVNEVGNSSEVHEVGVFKYRKKNGEIVLADITTTTVDYEGAVARLVIANDITEQVKAEDELQKSEARLQGIIDSQTNFMLRTDLEGYYTYYNPKFEKEFGWLHKVENLKGVHCMDSVMPHHQKRVVGTVEKCIENPNKVFQVEIDKPAKKGGVRTTIWDFVCLTDSSGNPSEIQCVGIDITEKKISENKLKQSLEEKNTLLAEIHHRVKNNLAVVSGLMQIQAFEEENKEVEAKLLDSVSRIRTMASIHELLYESNSFSHINFSSMVKKLTKDISTAMRGEKKIELEIFDDPIKLNINQAIPCAIMVNEVLTNAFKHAFKGENEGKIVVSMKTDGEKVSVAVRDNGVGFEEDKVKDGGSLGLHLIQILTQQIEGEYQYENADPGTRFTIEFVKKNIKGAASSLSV